MTQEDRDSRTKRELELIKERKVLEAKITSETDQVKKRELADELKALREELEGVRKQAMHG